MKNPFLFIFVLFVFAACQNDVKFNNPSFQGLKDNVFWRAIDSKATLNPNGSLLIEAYTTNEIVTFKIPESVVKTYLLGTSTTSTATYAITDASGTIIFSTGIGVGDGQIVITEYDSVNKTVSGTFKFNAKNTLNNPLAGPSINFQQGFFYKVFVSPKL